MVYESDMENPHSNSKLDNIHPEHRAAERAQKVEKAMAELEAAGYKFKYEEAPNDFRVTLEVDGKERTIHFTKVDKFFTAKDRDDDFDQIIKASIMFPNDKLVDALKKLDK
jgi:hypothetical protein